MATFDPKAHKGKAGTYEALPPAPYLLAMQSFERKTSRAGNPYLHAKWVVIAGAAKRRTFFDNMSIDQSNAGSMARLSMYAEQCGVEEAFDIDDDAEVTKRFVGRPFKALVKRETSGAYVNNGIERFLVGDKVTDADRQAMAEWVTAQAEAQEWSGRGDDAPPPSDDDFAEGYVPRGGPTSDDDIPF